MTFFDEAENQVNLFKENQEENRKIIDKLKSTLSYSAESIKIIIEKIDLIEGKLEGFQDRTNEIESVLNNVGDKFESTSNLLESQSKNIRNELEKISSTFKEEIEGYYNKKVSDFETVIDTSTKMLAEKVESVTMNGIQGLQSNLLKLENVLNSFSRGLDEKIDNINVSTLLGVESIKTLVLNTETTILKQVIEIGLESKELLGISQTETTNLIVQFETANKKIEVIERKVETYNNAFANFVKETCKTKKLLTVFGVVIVMINISILIVLFFQ